MHENYEVPLSLKADGQGIEKFWRVESNILAFSERVAAKPPSTGKELIAIAHEEGCGDMFPRLSREELKIIATDGKIPVHEHWKNRIADATIAPDTLLNLAGLASFTADQQMLDERIRGIIE
ncbi:MAG: hypothetical protein MUE32_03380 [Bacteroidales bacterium]|nr:hypothetical protein [Bacteroidales bacterium]